MKENTQLWLWILIAFLIGLFVGMIFGSHMNNQYWLDSMKLMNCISLGYSV